MRLGPRRPVPHAAVAQQQLREPMPAAHQVEPDLLARPGQVPRGLEARRRDRDRCQRAGHQLTQQQVGVAAIGLVAIPGRTRRLRRRDHLTIDPRRHRRAIQPEPGRAPPRSTRAPAQATQPATQRPAPPHRYRTAADTARPSPHPTTQRRSSARGHPSRPMSSFPSRPDLLRMGSAGAHLRPVKPPQNATEVRPSTSRRIILHRV